MFKSPESRLAEERKQDWDSIVGTGPKARNRAELLRWKQRTKYRRMYTKIRRSTNNMLVREMRRDSAAREGTADNTFAEPPRLISFV